MKSKQDTYCGFVAIMGRPNVGKSTLLNNVLGKKVSIVSRKPQTTRQRILGVKTWEKTQLVFVDTPGLHQKVPKAINRYMNQAAFNALIDIDVVILVIDGRGFTKDDIWVLRSLDKVKAPVILAANKVDLIRPKQQLLPLLAEVQQHYPFAATVPIAAATGDNIANLLAEIKKYLPVGPFCFPPEQITDRNEQFIVCERIREKLMRLLGQELPYALTVSLDRFVNEPGILRAAATIWVEKPGQKAIVIGKGGLTLKKVGQQARLELEDYFSKKVFLELWVKVKKGWSDDAASLHRFGYDE